VSTERENPFERFRRATHCPFASDSAWIVSGPPLEAVGSPGYLDAARAGLARTGREVADRGADGYVLRLPEVAGDTIVAIRNSAFDVIRHLATGDPVGFHELEDPSWWMPFGADRYFVVAFGPCFPSNHTRYTFGETETLLVFQHQQAFARRFPYGIPDAVRRQIKRRFAAAGRDYDYEMGVIPVLRLASSVTVPGGFPGQVDAG
jgi:hypothetical protein